MVVAGISCAPAVAATVGILAVLDGGERSRHINKNW